MRRPASHAVAESLALLILAAFLATSAGAANFAIRGFVIGNGATPSIGSTGSGRVLHGTAGQPAVGVSAGGTKKLCHGFWCFGGAQVLAVEEPGELDSHLPTRFALGYPYPNPVRETVRFAIDLPRASRVDLCVLDVQGRLVRRIEAAVLTAGFHVAAWDGRDEAGGRSASGVYFARLRVEGVVIGTRRLVVRP